MNTIAWAWERFQARCVPADTPEDKREEIRMAFYGGAQAMMSIFDNVAGHGEEAAEAALETLSDELLEFERSINPGARLRTVFGARIPPENDKEYRARFINRLTELFVEGHLGKRESRRIAKDLYAKCPRERLAERYRDDPEAAAADMFGRFIEAYGEDEEDQAFADAEGGRRS